MNLRIAVSVISFSVLVAMASSLQTAGATLPGGNGRIAFTRLVYLPGDQEQNTEIFTMNPDGSDVRRLTDSPGYDGDPAWSPDGTKIAFYSTRGSSDISSSRIHMMNADGSDVRAVIDDTLFGQAPAWSPDGKKLVFHGWGGGSSGTDVYVVNIDGSGLTNLTHGTEGGVAQRPEWYPDGSRILYMMSMMTTPPDLCIMAPDGSGKTNLTQSADWDSDPDWSPDGTSIFFNVQTSGTNPTFGLYEMDEDGGNVREFEPAPAGAGNAIWSPDGSRVALHAPTSGAGYAIFVMKKDGADYHQIGEAGDMLGSWQAIPGSGPTPVPAPPLTGGGCEEVVPAQRSSPTAAAAPTGGGRPHSDPALSWAVIAGTLLVIAGGLALRWSLKR